MPQTFKLLRVHGGNCRIYEFLDRLVREKDLLVTFILFWAARGGEND